MVMCLIFMTVFLALGVGLATMSGANVQLAGNQKKSARAFAAAESGLDIMRYWLSRVMLDASTPPAQYLPTIIGQVKQDLQYANATDLKLGTDGVLQPVVLNASTGENFSVQLSVNAADPSVLDVTVTGRYEQFERQVCVGFAIAPYRHPIFNYGMATKGPIQFPNNPTTLAASDGWEADIYTESSSSAVAVYVGGNTNFDGNISVGNPAAAVDFAGAVQIAGDVGQDAIDNHVSIGVDAVEFPEPDTDRFVKYATGPAVDPCTMDFSKGLTLTNAMIPAGTNPTFEGTVTIQGVLYIEQPNVVNFGSNVVLEGIMVGSSGTSTADNQINITGNFASTDFPSDSQFDAIRDEQGTSILTPGFDVSFTGNYSSIEGVVAASSLYFSGNASATLHGSLISYDDTPAVVEGNVSLTFDRANSVEIPAGFDTKRVLEYNASSYAMLH